MKLLATSKQGMKEFKLVDVRNVFTPMLQDFPKDTRTRAFLQMSDCVYLQLEGETGSLGPK